jgi:hypothetical protein
MYGTCVKGGDGKYLSPCFLSGQGQARTTTIVELMMVSCQQSGQPQ